MFTVALLGLDGAGKTSVAQNLLETFPAPIKYLYMNYHIPSSNVALPTSRLIYFIKWKRYQRRHRHSKTPLPQALPVHEPEYRADKGGHLASVGRLLHRLSEECFRQIVAWSYLRQGYIVLFDRHFLFQAALPTGNKRKQWLADRFHIWFLEQVYPRPDLVIFLDAPPKVLFERKQEGSLDFLTKRRAKYLEQGQRVSNFIRVDASQPLDKVLKDVSGHIKTFPSSKVKQSNGEISV